MFLSQKQPLIKCVVFIVTANIPSAPQKVRAIPRYDAVEVLWDVPLKNAQKVDLYVVSWVKKGSTDPVQTARLVRLFIANVLSVSEYKLYFMI